MSAELLPDDRFPNEYNTFELVLGSDSHRDPFVHHFTNDTCDTEAGSDDVYIDPDDPPVPICIFSTPHLDNLLACQPSSNEDFNIFDHEIALWLPLSCEEEQY
jgi:hypothetical protein